MQNNSRDDAWHRIMDARYGYLAGNPTYEYLSELQRQLADWLKDTQLEISSIATELQKDKVENMTECSPIDDQVTAAIARTLYVCAWADYEESNGRTYPGEDLMEIAPNPSSDEEAQAHVAAKDPIDRYVKLNSKSITALLRDAVVADNLNSPCGLADEYIDEFGHCLTMMSICANLYSLDEPNEEHPGSQANQQDAVSFRTTTNQDVIDVCTTNQCSLMRHHGNSTRIGRIVKALPLREKHTCWLLVPCNGANYDTLELQQISKKLDELNSTAWGGKNG